MAQLLVGLDVGSTSSKAVVFGTDGVAVSVGRAATPWRRSSASSSPTGGTELDADELLRAALDALSQAIADAPAGPVAGLGVTSMGESGVLLGPRGSPVAPVIAWHDNRDVDQVARLGGELGAERFAAHTGLPLRSQWSLTKHRWQLDHDPATATAVRRLNIAEWVVRGLGGEEASDVSLASRTGWLDLGSRGWWSESLLWSGMSQRLLPPLVTSGTPLGRVPRGGILERLVGAVLTTAGHDHQAAAVGADAAGPGDQLDSCGTAEALVRTVPAGLGADDVARLVRAGITAGWHVLPDQWALLGATEGGLVLQEVHTRLGPGDGLVWRAALQEVTDQIHDIHQLMTSVVGPHQHMVVTGGWSRDADLMQVKERAFGALTARTVDEAGARGAALLAGLAAGTFAGTADFPPLQPRVEPL